jgi:DNA-binding transcriptional LysR family regulator
VTPTQLRAFAAVVRLGSVKQAAAELGVTEAAVSLHVGQLRKELGDKLFVRSASGLAFTPGGLRLASRAAEMLGLQDRTVREVHQAAKGRRMLRLASSSLFAEHAAPGLIELFARRADDLDVELSVHHPGQFVALLAERVVDVAIGPVPPGLPEDYRRIPFLNYRLVVVVGRGRRHRRRPARAADRPGAVGQRTVDGDDAAGAQRGTGRRRADPVHHHAARDAGDAAGLGREHRPLPPVDSCDAVELSGWSLSAGSLPR